MSSLFTIEIYPKLGWSLKKKSSILQQGDLPDHVWPKALLKLRPENNHFDISTNTHLLRNRQVALDRFRVCPGTFSQTSVFYWTETTSQNINFRQGHSGTMMDQDKIGPTFNASVKRQKHKLLQTTIYIFPSFSKNWIATIPLPITVLTSV